MSADSRKTLERSVSCKTEHFTPAELVFDFGEVPRPDGAEGLSGRESVGQKIRRWLSGRAGGPA